MAAEQSAMAANGSMSATTILAHAGVDNVIIDQDNVNQFLEGAQQIESAAASVNGITPGCRSC
jgi:hypothetical protein